MTKVDPRTVSIRSFFKIEIIMNVLVSYFRFTKTIKNILIYSVLGSSLYVSRHQILTYKHSPRAERFNQCGALVTIPLQCGDRLYTSESDVYRCQNLTIISSDYNTTALVMLTK